MSEEKCRLCGEPDEPTESPAEVTHEQSRTWIGNITQGLPQFRSSLLAYVSQCEDRQQRAEREVAELKQQVEATEEAWRSEIRATRSINQNFKSLTDERDSLQARVAELRQQNTELQRLLLQGESPLTPADVRAILAEAATKAAGACGTSGHGYPLEKLAKAAKGETDG